MINQKYRILLTLSHLKKDALINSTAFLTFYNRKFNLIPHKKLVHYVYQTKQAVLETNK